VDRSFFRVWQTDRRTEFSSLYRVCITCIQRGNNYESIRHNLIEWGQSALTLVDYHKRPNLSTSLLLAPCCHEHISNRVSAEILGCTFEYIREAKRFCRGHHIIYFQCVQHPFHQLSLFLYQLLLINYTAGPARPRPWLYPSSSIIDGRVRCFDYLFMHLRITITLQNQKKITIQRDFPEYDFSVRIAVWLHQWWNRDPVWNPAHWGRLRTTTTTTFTLNPTPLTICRGRRGGGLQLARSRVGNGLVLAKKELLRNYWAIFLKFLHW